MKTKKIYNPPITEMVEVEFEGGFMADSIFDPENNRDRGVKIEGHEVGSEVVYDEWDGNSSTFSDN